MGQLVKENLEIPTIPDVASKALKQMSNPNVSGAQLSETISQDQGLTAKVLKVANSALYALPREVKNLQHAAMVLGFTTLKSIVISASCRSIYARFGILERTLWTHSVMTAMATHVLAQRLELKHRDEAFVAGLMHDVGRVVMINGARDQYKLVLKTVKEESQPVVDVEHQVFGFNHADVASILVQKWQLAPSLEHAVFLHHDPELADSLADDAKDLVYATHLGDAIAQQIGPEHQESGEPRPLVEAPLSLAYNLDENALVALADEVKTLYEQDHLSFS